MSSVSVCYVVTRNYYYFVEWSGERERRGESLREKSLAKDWPAENGFRIELLYTILVICKNNSPAQLVSCKSPSIAS